MNLIAIVCWYDERPSWLAGAVASLKKANVSHVVAVDGAYCLYPRGKASSGPEQAEAIIETCRANEMGLTLHAPQEPWVGNEVEKRNMALTLAQTVAIPREDWFLMFDADHFVVSGFGFERLMITGEDVADVRFTENYDALESGGPLRCLYRAQPGLAYVGNHYTVKTADGRDLHAATSPALDLSCMEISHRTRDRDPYRKQAQLDYCRRRDEAGIESVGVAACGTF